MDDFELECRARFQTFCDLYQKAKFHSLKRKYAAQAYEQIDAYLDWRDVQSL